MPDFSQSILKLNIKMRLYLWICNNFNETPIDYNFNLPGAFTIHIERSYPD